MNSRRSVEQAEFRRQLAQIVRSIDSVYGTERYLLIGAFARDVHVHLRAGLPLPRATADVDIGIAVPNAATFRGELERLDPAGTLRTRRRLPRPSGGDLPLDVLPFGSIAPDGVFEADEITYDIRGLEDSYRHADVLDLDDGTRVRLPSLSSLLALKLIAWAVRGKGTDAKDLATLLDVTASDPYAELIWDPASGAGDYGYEMSLEGPFVRGKKLGATFGELALERVLEVLDPLGEHVGRLIVNTPRRGVTSPSRGDQYEALRCGILHGRGG